MEKWNEKKVTLVLGGGGARGLAHIGVIRELEVQGYRIDEVIGCSIGALIGAIYAQGGLDILEEWMLQLNRKSVFQLMDFTMEPAGFMKGTKIMETLKKIIPDTAIESFPISFKAVANDLKDEKDVIFDSGSMYDAIRASISIPAVFTAVKRDEMTLFDGGVLNPLPVNLVSKKSDHIVIAVNLDGSPDEQLMSEKQKSKKLHALDILQLAYFAMRRKLSALTLELYQPDYVIHVPHNICGIWEYEKAQFLIEKGRQLTQEALKDKKL
ncbi:patatin-like phospholipase family protein [Sphingobacterium sp. SRCM116780]|uniref:patatin-like phospholipase family protein n=1 Tax=Sphingobacterium sp. SRCM116780 TaxID=2907623 RepID=UPI001F297E1A|nr:patatin-like phospholipase family protein [Sphingobacterium sp. SRCM116780]UIR57181.1 patatin-like phospholipase family protein [Sphingobacterium sp. SRCM116780]